MNAPLSPLTPTDRPAGRPIPAPTAAAGGHHDAAGVGPVYALAAAILARIDPRLGECSNLSDARLVALRFPRVVRFDASAVDIGPSIACDPDSPAAVIVTEIDENALHPAFRTTRHVIGSGPHHTLARLAERLRTAGVLWTGYSLVDAEDVRALVTPEPERLLPTGA